MIEENIKTRMIAMYPLVKYFNGMPKRDWLLGYTNAAKYVGLAYLSMAFALVILVCGGVMQSSRGYRSEQEILSFAFSMSLYLSIVFVFFTSFSLRATFALYKNPFQVLDFETGITRPLEDYLPWGKFLAAMPAVSWWFTLVVEVCVMGFFLIISLITAYGFHFGDAFVTYHNIYDFWGFCMVIAFISAIPGFILKFLPLSLYLAYFLRVNRQRAALVFLAIAYALPILMLFLMFVIFVFSGLLDMRLGFLRDIEPIFAGLIFLTWFNAIVVGIILVKSSQQFEELFIELSNLETVPND